MTIIILHRHGAASGFIGFEVIKQHSSQKVAAKTNPLHGIILDLGENNNFIDIYTDLLMPLKSDSEDNHPV